MGKKRKPIMEQDDEFLAQVGFFRDDYDAALQEMETQKKDIQRLIAILVEQGISIPGDILDRYVRRKSDEEEDLPFD